MSAVTELRRLAAKDICPSVSKPPCQREGRPSMTTWVAWIRNSQLMLFSHLVITDSSESLASSLPSRRRLIGIGPCFRGSTRNLWLTPYGLAAVTSVCPFHFMAILPRTCRNAGTAGQFQFSESAV